MTDDRRDRRERNAQQKGIFSRMFAPDEAGDATTTYSRDETGVRVSGRAREEWQGFTVERALEIIDELPSEVPRKSAHRIVLRTLVAAGINVEALESSTRSGESKLSSEIELSEQRIHDLENRTNEVVASLEDQIRKAREAQEYGVREEEDRISRARDGIDGIEKVRDFFGFPDQPEEQEEFSDEVSGDHDYDAEDEGAVGDEDEGAVGDETQVMERMDPDETQVLRPKGPLSREWDTRRSREDRDQ